MAKTNAATTRVEASWRTDLTIAIATSLPVLRFSSLTATSSLKVKRPNAPTASSSTMCVSMVGSATITTRVRSRPMPAMAAAAEMLTFCG